MKIYKNIGKFVLATIMAGLVLTACKPSDTKLQQGLVGTWKWNDQGGVHHTVTFNTDGKFTSQSSGYKDGQLSLQGTMVVRGGILISTVLAANDTNSVGMIDRCKIIKLKSHELILRPEGSQVEIRLKR